MRRKLFVVLIAFLFTQTSFTLPVNAAPQIDILSHSSFTDSLGFYHVVGEVENTGDTTLEFVKVTATFYNASHDVVDTSFTYTSLGILLPGRKSPFEIYLYDTAQSAKVDHYSLNIEYAVYLLTFPTGLEILSNSSYEDILGFMHIVGEIKNIGTIPTTYVQVIATCYDEAGTVVATGFTYSSPHSLDSDEVAPFEILVTDTDRVDLVSSYTLTAESNDYAIIPEFTSLICTLILIGLATVLALRRNIANH